MSEGYETAKDWEEARKAKLDAVLKMLTDLTDEERLEVRERFTKDHADALVARTERFLASRWGITL